jgi:hypothetical protein
MAASAWLAVTTGMILAAVDLPLPVRIAICVAIATPGIAAIRRVFLLRGPRSVRALSWSERVPALEVRLGPGGPPLTATLAHGSFRLGHSCLFLWLRVGSRSSAVFIDGSRQEVRAFRGLCRRLRWPPREP